MKWLKSFRRHRCFVPLRRLNRFTRLLDNSHARGDSSPHAAIFVCVRQLFLPAIVVAAIVVAFVGEVLGIIASIFHFLIKFSLFLCGIFHG